MWTVMFNFSGLSSFPSQSFALEIVHTKYNPHLSIDIARFRMKTFQRILNWYQFLVAEHTMCLCAKPLGTGTSLSIFNIFVKFRSLESDKKTVRQLTITTDSIRNVLP